MGIEVLFWIWVLTWMAKTAATDVLHAVKGTPNPRYELKKQRAATAGQTVAGQPRYGTREWLGDLYSDALAAQTEKRRAAVKAKSAPVDDMVDVVREPPAARKPPEPTAPPARPEPPAPPQPPTIPDNRPLAPVIPMFPNPKQIEKEITMASSEVTGLSTAMAFADAAASAHNSFATAGAEGYVGALESGGMGGAAVGSAREAMEASGVAAAKWSAHKSELERQMNVKEAYQGQQDAADKDFLLAE
ncbi:hypothetical protein [Micromonospora sp. NPDC005299]|uniref:hypothetical protein n=1 Tax=Micromonospora sp. NPDC005299 TaxID=3364231 RepID=UPI0036B2AD54